MAPSLEGVSSSEVNLEDVLTLANKPFNVKLNNKHISWNYKKKQPFSNKEKKNWTCSKFLQFVNDITLYL